MGSEGESKAFSELCGSNKAPPPASVEAVKRHVAVDGHATEAPFHFKRGRAACRRVCVCQRRSGPSKVPSDPPLLLAMDRQADVFLSSSAPLAGGLRPSRPRRRRLSFNPGRLITLSAQLWRLLDLFMIPPRFPPRLVSHQPSLHAKQIVCPRLPPFLLFGVGFKHQMINLFFFTTRH